MIYERATGLLRYSMGAGLGVGWSGRNTFSGAGEPILGLNNPALSHLHNIGPLPPGRYRLADVSSERGPLTIRLEPLPNEGEKPDKYGNLPHMLTRSGFLIHGWRAVNPFDSSDGCICMPNAVRQDLANIVGAYPADAPERVLEVL